MGAGIEDGQWVEKKKKKKVADDIKASKTKVSANL